MRAWHLGTALLFGAAAACNAGDDGAAPSAEVAGTGGGSATGGASGTGGKTVAGGASGTGGATPKDGGAGVATGGGGVAAAGGSAATGGAGLDAGDASIADASPRVDSGDAGAVDAARTDAGDAGLADLDYEFYRCNVEPILDRSCSMLACHGKLSQPFHVFARGRLRNDEMVPQVNTCLSPGQPVNLNAEGTGTVMCVGWSAHTTAEWQSNFKSARSLMTIGMAPDESLLLRKPSGAVTHGGPVILKNGGADYAMIRRWLGGEKYAGTCDPKGN
jgi:hypothetical protein